jgi:hypothetical protein
MGLTKAYLAAKGGSDRLDFMFNPKELSITKSSSWKDAQSRGAKKAPKKEFVGTNARTLSMELLFDGWASGKGDVSSKLKQLFDWTCPTQESMSANKPQPSVVVLHWGSQAWFEGYVKQVNATYTLFDDQGTPLRATAKVSLEELPADAASQNPTSGSLPGHRTYRAVSGDSLHSIAYQEYRRPGYWRALAEANGIDDPLRLEPGMTLLIPPQNSASKFA